MKENKQQEQLYLKLHVAFLSAVLLLGIVWIFVMVETAG
jgi:hypothetical protein